MMLKNYSGKKKKNDMMYILRTLLIETIIDQYWYKMRFKENKRKIGSES